MTGPGRSYLSIGDVLTLLRQEFPDVTISKIRFLESQGLVNPERTPSGYRKFYDEDVERLRWVLRQQREHFLPLKVIKGRLDAAGQAVPPDGLPVNGSGSASSGTVGQAVRPEPAGLAPGDPRPVDPHQVGPAPAAAAVPSDPAAARQHEPTRSSQDSPAQGVGAGVVHQPVGAPDAAAGPRADRPPSRLPPAGLAAGGAPVVGSPGDAPWRELPGADAPGGPPEHEPVAPRAAGLGATGAPGVGRVAAPDGTGGAAQLPGLGADGAAPASDAAPVGAVGLTAEELAAAAGLRPAQVTELTSYGLLAGRTMAGATYYDAEALAVARMAAGFAAFGVEARHLRLHKHAAEREAGFIEQVVLPLVKQRNPAAHQRAAATVDQLAELGQSLRSVLLRRTLRDLLG